MNHTVEQMREEITSHAHPKKQTQSLVALAALALRLQLDERFVAVVGAILDALDRATTTLTTRGVDDVNDVNDKEEVVAAALAALSCVVGTVDGATKEMLKENNYAHEPTWVEGRTHHIMTFRSRGKEARMVLEEVMKTGIGKHFGRIDLAEITASIPTLKRLVSRSTDERRSLKYCPCLGKRSFTLTDRMTLQEIHGIVDGQLHLTCEYITLVFVAAIIASIIPNEKLLTPG